MNKKFTLAVARQGTVVTMIGVSLLLLLFASVDSSAGKTTLVQHEEWIQSNVSDKPTVNNQVEIVKPGDTAGQVLTRLGFSASEIAELIKDSRPVYALKDINIGHKFTLLHTGEGTEIDYQISAEQQLKLINTDGSGWNAKVVNRELETRLAVVEVSIKDSLFYDAAKAGLDDSLTMKLVDMFSWDIDFTRDVRKDDSFKVMYEETFNDEGKHVAYSILAAEFNNNGQIYTGFRYQDKNGDVEYYSEDGHNLRKTYLKSPVKFSRISSRFTTSRKHPVLGYTRAHRGVDYAAKSGTPIHALADGKVIFQGWKNGYGRYVEIRHNNGIHSTAYAHMQKFGNGISKGKYVKQGQVIGYVGMSGLATGPHLHFEFKSRGVAVNPLKIKHKSALPIAKEEFTSFRVSTKEMLRKMAVQSHSTTWG